MKRLILSAAALALPVLAATAFAAETPAMDDASRMSYALGYQLGRDLAGAELKPDALVKGLQDGNAGAAAAIKPEEMEAALAMLQQRIGEQRAKEQAAEMERSAAAGAAFWVRVVAGGNKSTKVVPWPTLEVTRICPR